MLDGTIYYSNFDTCSIIKKERLNRLHPFNRLNTSWKLIYRYTMSTKLRVDYQFKRPSNIGRHEMSRYIETSQFMPIEQKSQLHKLNYCFKFSETELHEFRVWLASRSGQ